MAFSDRLCLAPLCCCYICFLLSTAQVSWAASRLVFCHYMLWAPLYSDDVTGFRQEIQLAQQYGIDAFALNTAVWNSEYETRADNLYDAADELNFSLFFSADMSGSLTSQDVETMLTRYANRTSQFRYNGKQFLSSFLGQDTVFSGYSDTLSSWRDGVLNPAGGNISFVPFFVTDGSQSSVADILQKFDSILTGLLAWDTSAWPYVNGDYNNPSNASDQAYLAACEAAGKVYMASVSPWFFAHETRENLVKGNYAGAGLWTTHWMQLINLSPPLVEILTWNDWAERTYVTPVGTGWGAPAYNDTNFPHEAFLHLGQHYIQWYKTGSEPTIEKETLYIFYYTHSKNATASNDSLGEVQNANVLDDRLHAIALTTQPGVMQLSSGGATSESQVGTGISMVSMPFQEGQQSVTLLRDNSEVLSLSGVLPISNTIQIYDFNVYSDFTPAH
eukprot:c24295_g1_i1 orf=442-1779(-)